MERVREVLGEDWLRRWVTRHGRLPTFLADPSTDAVAYAELVEIGLRLASLADVVRLRRLTKEWSRHLEEIRTRHVRLQLEVAALARAFGAAVEFEAPVGGLRRPADVLITTAPGPLIAECFCVYSDQETRQALSYDRDLGLRLELMAVEHDLVLSGYWGVRLLPADTDALLGEAAIAAAQAAADRASRTVTRPGIELVLTPGPPSAGETVTFTGPRTASPGWHRARKYVRDKAADWTSADVPTWLRLDLLDGTWQFSELARRTLPEKSQWIAALVAQEAARTGIAGAVVSSGPLISPRAQAQEYAGPGGIFGLRRGIDALRVRETVVVPLSPQGVRQAEMWRDLSDAEPPWLENALRAASLPASVFHRD